MTPLRVAYLGPAGTFAEAALRTLTLPEGSTRIPSLSVVDALDAVRSGQADAAMVPFENSVEGSVATTLDQLARGEPLVVRREALLPVRFVLLARPGTEAAEVRSISSHPHAQAQCRQWLAAHLAQARFTPAPSTADAARLVGEGQFDAAVSAPAAAEHYGLAVLAEDIGDDAAAVTRFVLVGRPAAPEPPTGADRTTVVAFQPDDHPGTLLEILTEFAVRGVNLTRLESRPTGEALGRYCFSIDAEGHIADARVADALSALRRVCKDVRFLGSYPRADGAEPTVRRGMSDGDYRTASAWVSALQDGRAV